jgi:hypothetical protein
MEKFKKIKKIDNIEIHFDDMDIDLLNALGANGRFVKTKKLSYTTENYKEKRHYFFRFEPNIEEEKFNFYKIYFYLTLILGIILFIYNL